MIRPLDRTPSLNIPEVLASSDSPQDGMFQTIYAALDACSRPLIGTAQPRLLTIPIRDDAGSIAGGLWACTSLGWLHIQMLFVPEKLRGHGIGTALMTSAETEARRRGCHGAHVDTFSFQAVRFYEKLGFTLFGTLDDCPPGHQRLFFYKRWGGAADPCLSDGVAAGQAA